VSEPAALVGLGFALLFGFATGYIATSASDLRTALLYPAIVAVALVVLFSYSAGSTLAWVLAVSFVVLIPMGLGYLLGALLVAWRRAAPPFPPSGGPDRDIPR
jgi:hypothetical protein